MIPLLQETEQLTFDYDHLSPDVRTEVQEHTTRLHELERRTGEGIIEMGQRLIAVKARLGHGQFGAWIDAEFGWSEPTAQRFMRVSEVFQNRQIDGFQTSALYALASGNIPEHIRERFIDVAEAGRPVRHKDVQEAIAAHREEEQRRNTVTVDADTGEVVEDDDEPIVEGEYVDANDPAVRLGWDMPAPSKNVHVSNNSGENEWYTPPEYIEAAREVLSDIDLDPASNPKANEWIRAARIHTRGDNGLAYNWRGRVWMNPPYAQPLITEFCEKVVEEYRAGRVTEAIVLVNNATETRWFQAMARSASSVCFPKGRIRYFDATGKPANTPLQGQAFVYFGKNPNGFRDVFERFGVVL